MKLLVVGAGAREHALAAVLERGGASVVCAPGNPGIARDFRVAPLDATNPAALLALAEAERVDLTVIGPEAPLAAGVADQFLAAAGLAARLVDRVVVSTDDDEIAAVARDCGAEVPFIRPAELAEDTTPDLPVFQHALAWLREHEGWVPEIVVQLRPTSPLRPPAPSSPSATVPARRHAGRRPLRCRATTTASASGG
jgi:Trk K+ transport system NAD-binding subunit